MKGRRIDRRLVMLVVFAVLPAGRIEATVHERFESPEPSWRLRDADCAIEINRHQRTFDESHSDQGCEYLRIRAGLGTYIHLAHDVPSARVIAELSPCLWVKSDREGIQLFARVVLPRTRDKSGQPVTTLLPGDVYRDLGSWQQLRIEDVQRELNRKVWVLRTQLGPHVDGREAYIDLLVLNSYGGVGVTNLWVDDLELVGYASTSIAERAGQDRSLATPASFPVAPMAGGRDDSPPANNRIRLDGSILSVEERPFFPRIIEHRGESLEWLKAMGFNVVRLQSMPTRSDQIEAERLNLWLLAPPPVNARSGDANRVLAWTLGDASNSQDMLRIRHLAEQLRTGGLLSQQPLVCDVHGTSVRYGGTTDLVILHRPTIGTSFPMNEFWSWLRRRSDSDPRDTPFWAAIDTEIPERLESQISALSGGPPPATAAEPIQLRTLSAEAVAAGARGLYFRSRYRLDAEDGDTRLRAASLRLINRELAMVEPWIAGGTLSGELDVADADVRARVLETDRARLLVLTQLASDQQFVAPPWSNRTTSLLIHGIPITDQAYWLGPTRLEPLRGQRASGIRVSLDRSDAVAYVLLTQDPLAINHVRRKLVETRRERAELRQQMAALLLARTADVDRRLNETGNGQPQVAALLEQAKLAAAQAERLLRAGDEENATRAANQALHALYQSRRTHWERAQRAFPTPLASPLLATFASLPMHWNMAARMPQAQWRTNLLAGGDFESLDHMVRSGWQQNRGNNAEIATHVELSFRAPRSGRSALRLSAESLNAAGMPLVDEPPVLITSGAVPVQAGQIVRIQGWVKIPAAIRGSQDGLLIYDSLGGTPLAERFLQTKGWQEFTLYRAAREREQVTLFITLSGVGEVWLDDVSISTLE